MGTVRGWGADPEVIRVGRGQRPSHLGEAVTQGHTAFGAYPKSLA